MGARSCPRGDASSKVQTLGLGFFFNLDCERRVDEPAVAAGCMRELGAAALGALHMVNCRQSVMRAAFTLAHLTDLLYRIHSSAPGRAVARNIAGQPKGDPCKVTPKSWPPDASGRQFSGVWYVTGNPYRCQDGAETAPRPCQAPPRPTQARPQDAAWERDAPRRACASRGSVPPPPVVRSRRSPRACRLTSAARPSALRVL